MPMLITSHLFYYIYCWDPGYLYVLCLRVGIPCRWASPHTSLLSDVT